MGRREAARTEQRIHLDRRVKLCKFGGDVDPVSGRREFSESAVVWAAVESGRSELDITRTGTTLKLPSAVVVRWETIWESLATGRIYVAFDTGLPDEDANTASLVTNLVQIGRGRFLRLELD